MANLYLVIARFWESKIVAIYFCLFGLLRRIFDSPRNDRQIERFYFFAKAKRSKNFWLWIDSLKVRDLPLIHDSPKWILRYAQYDEKFYFLDSSDSCAEVFLMRNRGCVATSEEIRLGVY